LASAVIIWRSAELMRSANKSDRRMLDLPLFTNKKSRLTVFLHS
jgi:hypothetical protein